MDSQVQDFMNSEVSNVNPYAPVEVTERALADDAESCVEFALKQWELQKAEEQFLLRKYITRLSVGSIVMIILSLFVMATAIPRGELALLVAVVASMTASAVVYLGLIHRPKKLLRSRLPNFGVQSGADCRVRSGPEHFEFSSPAGDFRWPNRSLRRHRSSHGILVWPDPTMFIFIPKSGRFVDEDYKSFWKRIVSRSR